MGLVVQIQLDKQLNTPSPTHTRPTHIVPPSTTVPSSPTSDLTDILPSFHRPTLGPLLARQPLNLTLARRASVLGLLCLFLALRSGLLFLAFLDRQLSRCRASLWSLRAPLLDHI